MSYCVEKGIPHSEFLRWSAEDRAKTIAYISEQALSCTMCGTSEWEWNENPHAYTTEEKFCKGCYVKHAASEDAGRLPGTTIVLAPSNPERIAKAKALNDRRARMKREDPSDDSE